MEEPNLSPLFYYPLVLKMKKKQKTNAENQETFRRRNKAARSIVRKMCKNFVWRLWPQQLRLKFRTELNSDEKEFYDYISGQEEYKMKRSQKSKIF